MLSPASPSRLPCSPRAPARPAAGFTLLEVLVVLAVLGILLSLGFWSYLATRNPPRDAARTVHAHLLTLRSQAMSNTQARRLVLTDGQQLVMQASWRCSETDQSRWTELGRVTLEPSADRVILAASDPAVKPPAAPASGRLVVCFTPRGLATPEGTDTQARFLTLKDSRRGYRIEVALNGAVRTRAE